MRDEAQSALTAFIVAFERVNGRPPTADENREALALVEVVHAAKLDPFLVFYLANKRAQDALERIPAETQSVVDEALISVKELIERASSGERISLRGQQYAEGRSSSTTIAPSSSALPSEVRRLLSENASRRLARTNGIDRQMIAAYVLASATLAFTSWAIGGYSMHAVPTLLIFAGFISGVAGTSVLYEIRGH